MQGATRPGSQHVIRLGSFDPRPRAGGDGPAARGGRRRSPFRSTPPCRGRPSTCGSPPASNRCFDPRPRAGGDARTPCHRHRRQAFRSTPPCRGRLRHRPFFGLAAVSIHAPVQGATPLHQCRPFRRLFRSTPPCRGRPRSAARSGAGARFDPRPRAGGDLGQYRKIPPVRSFDPRPRAGGDDQAPGLGQFAVGGFDPRPRAGGDRFKGAWGGRGSGFDPRPRAGGDGSVASKTSGNCEFRSTPPCRGRPEHTCCLSLTAYRFRSTPPCRGRLQGFDIFADHLPVSIHAPVQGATASLYRIVLHSQSRF